MKRIRFLPRLISPLSTVYIFFTVKDDSSVSFSIFIVMGKGYSPSPQGSKENANKKTRSREGLTKGRKLTLGWVLKSWELAERGQS